MKKNALYLSGIIVVLFFITTAFSLKSPDIKGVNEKIDVKDFNAVSIAIPSDTYIEIGNQYSLEINAKEDILAKIDVEVENGTLIIKTKNKRDNINGDVEIHIVAPKIEAVSVAGSSKVIAEKSFPAEELILKIAGSGKMEFQDLKVDELEVKIAGSGDIFLKGSADEMQVSVAGSGNVDATDFEVDELNTKISGSGNIKAFVTGELNATIAGSGKVSYKGNPEVNSTISGSGKVSKLK